ncbi:hypothetical protein ACLK1T_05740 [Escherichia coli]
MNRTGHHAPRGRRATAASPLPIVNKLGVVDVGASLGKAERCITRLVA